MHRTFQKASFLVNKKRCLANIEKMSSKAKLYGVDFRPHFKTHNSSIVGSFFKENGIDKITVSSLDMAEKFAADGFSDIIVAIPFNINDTDRAIELSRKITLGILIENEITAGYIAELPDFKCDYYIEIDTGYKRTGVDVNDYDSVKRILNAMQTNSNQHFKGFLTHSGHSYHSSSVEEIIEIHNITIEQMAKLKKIFFSRYPGAIISIGDTPCCSLADNFNGVDEIRPGNFVFFDLMQYKLGVCRLTDIASLVIAPVIAKYPNRNELVIHAGAVHLSKEYLVSNGELNIPQDEVYYGVPVIISKSNSWFRIMESSYVSKLSQEHGTVISDERCIKNIEIGNMIGILPVHSCLTRNLYKEIALV